MTLAARSNFIHSDMQVPNSYTANISTAKNTVFLCVQFQCIKLRLVFNPPCGLGHDQDRISVILRLPVFTILEKKCVV